MSSIARTLYHTRNHTWLRLKGETVRQSCRIVEMGITSRGLEDIGDITSIKSSAVSFLENRQKSEIVDAPVIRGQELFQIHYDGHLISSADELYHTVWESFSDHMSILSPVSGRAVATKTCMNGKIKSLEREGIDEQTVLMDIKISDEEWKHICLQSCFVNETEYLKTIEKEPRGTFY